MRLPIPGWPAFVQAFPLVFGKTRVIERDTGSGAARNQLESHNRIDTGWPRSGTPRLDNPLIRRQFHVAAFDTPAEQLECRAWLGLNLSRVPGEGAELFGVEQRFINPMRRGFEIDILVNGGAWLPGLSLRRGGPRPPRIRPIPRRVTFSSIARFQLRWKMCAGPARLACLMRRRSLNVCGGGSYPQPTSAPIAASNRTVIPLRRLKPPIPGIILRCHHEKTHRAAPGTLPTVMLVLSTVSPARPRAQAVDPAV